MSLLNFPRNALIWLLVSVFFVYLPLQMQLPLWTFLVFIVVFSWRWLMHLGRLPYPSKVVKVAVVVIGIGAVLISAHGRFHLESATTFILVVSLLKVLEIKNQRDGYIILFLSFFLLAVNFLYDQGIVTTIYSIFVIWILISALVGLHQTQFSEQTAKAKVSTASKASAQVLLLSLPIMLVMFVLFPRLDPLWSLNLQSNKAKTGLSESMSPGDIAELSNSDELVFRVKFDGDRPTIDKLYWRALVLDQHRLKEGLSQWSVSRSHNQVDWYPQSWKPEQQQGVYDYTIIQEPTNKRWLVGLRGVAAMENNIGITEDDLIISKKKVFQRKEYKVRSWPEMSIAEQGIDSLTRNDNLRLDEYLSEGGRSTVASNPQTRQFAEKIYSAYGTDQERVAAALAYFQQSPFKYTLKPQRMGFNDIDDFLFNKQSGFCAHYSSSFTFLMRSMGIPARVVAGYQGGEFNQESGHLTVRQYDAHAWVEVWLEGIGWKSYDPTALVAPDRISLGLRNSLNQQEDFLPNNGLSLIKFSHLPIFNDMRLKLDEINYYWHQTVLNFNKKNQSNTLRDWFGRDFLKKSLYWLAGLFCVLFSLITVIVLWHRHPKHLTLVDKSLLTLEQRLLKFSMNSKSGQGSDKQSLGREGGEGLQDYSSRLQQAFPEHKESIRIILQQLQNYYYTDKSIEDNELAKQIVNLSKTLTRRSSYKSSHHQ